MNSTPEHLAQSAQPMPAQALAALQQGNKIEAIKIVRVEHRIGLKEAKEYVERHVESDPALQAAMRANSMQIGPGQLFRFLAIVALVVIVFLWWKNG